MNSFASYCDSWRRAASTALVITAAVGAFVLAVGVSRASAATGPYGLTFDPSHAVLVSMSGNDSFGQGTESNPYRTIGKGIQVAAALHENVYVAGSSSPYVESVVALSGVGVYGGFDPSTWSPSSPQATTIQAPDGSEQAVLANTATNVVLYRLTLRGPNGLQTGSRGQSNSYGLRAINGSKVALLAVTVSGGRAAPGANGNTPSGFLSPGAVGTSGSLPGSNGTNCQQQNSQGAGGAGGSGVNGASGGAGGAGGGFSNRGDPQKGGDGGSGLPAGPGGGPGGAPQTDGGGVAPQTYGQIGSSGSNGSRGGDGNGGSDVSNHSADVTDWVGADGTRGSAGAPGNGGSGGGGGGGRTAQCFLCTDATSGGGGGGGGGGGQGGQPGGAGQAGGASFGVFLENSTLTADDSSISAGTGGNGGAGALGQAGASGGHFGNGAGASVGCGGLSVAPGGNGGMGGQGGTGGTGGGGAGGPSAAIYQGPWASFALRNSSTAGGQPGQPGVGGGSTAATGQASETIPAGATSNTTLDFDHDVVTDVNDPCPTVAGGPTDLSRDGCPGSPSPLPQDTGRPTIQGLAVEGQTLTEVGASWSNGPLSSFAYQWARCDGSGSQCAAIPGATAVSYTVGPADVGATLEVSESARNNYGWSSPAWSDPTTLVKSAAPVNVAPPTVVGPAVAGQTLAVQRGVWANGPTTFQYQWFRCTATGANCRTVGGQTGLSYGLTGQDVGSTIKVQEIGVNGWGASAPAISAAAGPVVDAPLAVQAYALVGLTASIVPGPVASFSQSGEAGVGPGSYTATISWGDGSHSRGSVIVRHPGGYLVNGAHAYAKRGNYTVAVRVTAASGASSVGTNRVSVFTAAVCPKGSAARHQNCLGDVALPSGCVAPGTSLRLAIPSAGTIASVGYVIDHGSKFVEGRGRRFAAALSTVGLKSGTHRLIARVTYRTGRPRRLYKDRSFAVC